MFHVKQSAPHILLVNPWITDFAAYNFWIKPLGLLYLASLLRQRGARVTLIDCLDSYSKQREYGDGKFSREIIVKPEPLSGFPRNYSRYGIDEAKFRTILASIERPILICMTSGMTYWYPGVFETIRILRHFFPGIPILLGGIYATLCYHHAVQYSEADFVFRAGQEGEAIEVISRLTDLPTGPGRAQAEASIYYPAFDLYAKLDYLCLRTSVGCPFRCAYCASFIFSDAFTRREPTEVVEEIVYWTSRYEVRNIAFYDDALLFDAPMHIVPILEELARRGVRCSFHAPNGLHAREIDEEMAALMYQSGFKTVRLGLETSNEAAQAEMGGKISNDEFRRAVLNLRRAGYSPQKIGVYILVGLPGQRMSEVQETIAFVKEVGAKPMLAEYSPVPGTPLFEKAKRFSGFDLENEPLFHNNSILPCQWEGFGFTDYQKLKEELRG